MNGLRWLWIICVVASVLVSSACNTQNAREIIEAEDADDINDIGILPDISASISDASADVTVDVEDPSACDPETAPCEGGQFCDRARSPAVCVDFALVEGERCVAGMGVLGWEGWFRPCAEGLVCRGEAVVSVRIGELGAYALSAGACVPPAVGGEPCLRGVSAYGSDDWLCASGLECNTAATPPRCDQKYQGQAGDPCSWYTFCDAMTDCNLGEDGSFCVERGSLGVGEACGGDFVCAEGSLCNFQEGGGYRCHEKRSVGLGEGCSDQVLCADGLECVSYVCAAPSAAGLGTRCTQQDQCAQGLSCVSVAENRSECLELGQSIGAPCLWDGGCGPGLICELNDWALTCAPGEVDGARCDGERQCGNGSFCDLMQYPAVCRPNLTEGALCGPYSQCEDGLTCDRERLPPTCVARGPWSLCGYDVGCPFSTTTGECYQDHCLPRPAPVGEGGTCASGWDCEEGLLCAQDTCRAPGGVGDSCVGQSCVAGLRCHVDGLCGEPRAEGEGCAGVEDCLPGLGCFGEVCRAPGDVDAECYRNADCVLPLWCGEQRCRLPLVEGEVCTDFTRCEEGLSCRNQGGVKTCTPTIPDRTPAVAGEWCQLWDEECDAGLVCRPDLTGERRCREPGLARVGEGCVWRRDCALGLSCAAGICAVPIARGELCAETPACALDAWCAPSSSTCEPRRGVGDACEDLESCLPELVCAEGACRTVAEAEALAAANPPGPWECSASGPDCGVGRYCNDNICLPIGGLGAICEDLTWCEPGLICGGTAPERTCQERPEEGDACVFGVCALGFDCRGALCVAPLKSGEACEEDSLCGHGLFCDAGFCRPWKQLGEPCNERGCDAGLHCAPTSVCVTWVP